jgi:hypothetical protein
MYKDMQQFLKLRAKTIPYEQISPILYSMTYLFNTKFNLSYFLW